MAEKYLQTAPSDYISVIVNFKNLRFMTLIKENCLISDLIREVENTFTKLCSVKVKIKTLKNSVNAVLPNWYPVAPLIRNKDEIFAFTDNAAEVLNIDLTKHGNCGTSATSPLGSGIMPDSGFASPVVKPRTFRERDGPLEQKGMDEDGVERQGGQGGQNFSQDEGNELLSEIFSLQDHNQHTPKQVGSQRKKPSENCRKNNTDSEKERESLLEVDQARKTLGKTQNTKNAGKNLQEITNSPRNEILDESQNEPDSLVGQEKIVKNSVDDTQGKKEVYKSKEKTVASDSESSSDSSDESSWKSNESTNKAQETKNASQQKKSSQNNNSLESIGAAAKKAKETQKASQMTKSTETAQNKDSAQKLNIKRENASSKMRMKLIQENSVLGAAGHESDSSDDSTYNEAMDVDTKHENKNKKLALSLRKRTNVSGEKNDENMEMDAENVTLTEENSELVSKTGQAKSAAKAGNKESESSDSLSENEDMVVDEGGDSRNNKLKTKTTGVESQELESGKDAVAKVSAKKGNKLGENTIIADEQGDSNKIHKDTGKKTDNSKNRKGKETKVPETTKTLTQSSGNEIPRIVFIDDKDIQESSSDNESAVRTQEAKTKEVKGEMSASNKKDHTGKDSMKNESKGDSKKLDTKSKTGTTKKDQSRKGESSSDSTDSDERETSKKPKNNTEKEQGGSSKKNDNVSKNGIKVTDITMKDTAKKTENIKETNGSKKGEKNNVVKAKPDKESDLSSVSDSSWSSSDDEDKEVKTTNIKTLKNKNETATRTGKDESQMDVIDGDKSKNKNESPTTPAPKSSSKGEVKDNITKVKGKRKDAVKNDDKDKQPNLDPAPSPAKSVRYKKGKENSNKNNFASPAKSVARSKKGGSSKTKADLTKIDKAKGKYTEGDAKSESSVSTLKAPFTQLPAKDKVKSKGRSESGDSSGDEDAVKKGKEILKDGKKKGKHNSVDKKTGLVATTSADQTQPKDPNTPILLPQTPSTSTTRKSAAMLSASKVASWLLSNPVSENVAEVTSSETKSPQKAKTRSKIKTKDNITNVVEATNSETAVKPKTNSINKTKENVTNVESIADKIDSDKTLLSPKGATRSQKRKLDEVSEQEQSTKAKKNKKKKSEGKKNEKQQLDEETQVNQDKPPAKSPVTTKKGKNTSLSLPKISKGLSALVEDESDYNTKSSKKSKKQKLTPPKINRRLKQTGFLTPSNTVERKATGSKTPKSRVKKIPSSQPSKTIEMNEKEQEFLESGAVNLETLLNDESIKW